MKYAALSILLCASACSVPSAHVMARAARYELDGSFAASNNGAAAATDTDQLGMDDAENSFNPRVDIDFGSPKLTVEYTDFSFSGTGTTNDTIELGGSTIPAGDTVDSDLDLALYSVLLTWDLIPTDMFELGIGVGVVGADLDASIQSTTNPNLDAHTKEFAPIPVLVVRAGFEVGRFSAEALARGIQVDVSDVDAHYFDVDVYGRLTVGSLTKLSGAFDVGWRFTDIDVDYTDDQSRVEGDFEFSGPYLGLTLSF